MSYFLVILIFAIIYSGVYKQLEEKYKKVFSVFCTGVLIIGTAYFFGEAIGEAYYYFQNS